MPDKPESSQNQAEEPRIGVYVCNCGGNIGDVVRCQQVADALGKLPDVVVSREHMFMCSDPAQLMIKEDIEKHGVNRVVVGACSPFLHEQTFRRAVSRAGLNPYLYTHVGLREQDSWVHHHSYDEATDKAARLMAAGVAKARYLEALEPVRLEAKQHVLVIGGGVAGLRAAWDCAQRGLAVSLVEKLPFVGGHMAQLEKLFPTGESARELLHGLIDRVANHPRITVYTRAEVVDLKGYVGDFHAQIRQDSRGISPDIAEEAIEACTVEVPNEFDYGLTKRKVIYRAYEGCYPPTPAVDWNYYVDGCVKLNGEPLHLKNEPQTFEINVGAIVVATGFKPYQPQVGEYLYGLFPEVLTLPEFIRLLALKKDEETLHWNNHPVRNVAFIHCVGSRQLEGINKPQPDGNVNEYCSRVCCTATLQAANELVERYPGINVFDVYEDIRTYGRGHEEYYTQASHNRVRFLRFHNDELPGVLALPPEEEHPLAVQVHDYLTWGEDVEIPVDLVVLAVGMMPQPIQDLIELFKINAGNDRFLMEVHPKLQPVETAVAGIVLAGTAQGPMNIQESCAAASAAAAKVAGLLGQAQVELEPFVARVNQELCQGSGDCLAACPYEGAITLEDVHLNGQTARRAVVTPANCKGCGACVGVCPNMAIDLLGWTLKQYDAMLDALFTDIPVLEEVPA
jgi:heterodisulfide reductase subunit A2